MIDGHDAPDVQRGLGLLTQDFELRGVHSQVGPPLPACRHHPVHHHARAGFQKLFQIRLVEVHAMEPAGRILHDHIQDGHVPPTGACEIAALHGSTDRGSGPRGELSDGSDYRPVFVTPRQKPQGLLHGPHAELLEQGRPLRPDPLGVLDRNSPQRCGRRGGGEGLGPLASVAQPVQNRTRARQPAFALSEIAHLIIVGEKLPERQQVGFHPRRIHSFGQSLNHLA